MWDRLKGIGNPTSVHRATMAGLRGSPFPTCHLQCIAVPWVKRKEKQRRKSAAPSRKAGHSQYSKARVHLFTCTGHFEMFAWKLTNGFAKCE